MNPTKTSRYLDTVGRFAVDEMIEVHFRTHNGNLTYVLTAVVAPTGAISYTLRTGSTYPYHFDSFVGRDRWMDIPRKAVEGWQLRVLEWLVAKYTLELVV